MSRRLRQYEMAERLGQIGHWSWRIGAETVVLSPEAYRIFGKSPDAFEASHENVARLFHPDDQSRLASEIRRIVRDQGGFEFQGTVTREDGDVTVQTVGECEIGEKGRITSVFGVIQDVTGAFNAKQDLDRANSRQIDFAELSSDWLWEMGPDLRFSYVSVQVEKVLGWPCNLILGRTRRELVMPDDVTPEMERHLADLEAHKPFRDFHYRRTMEDGTCRHMSISGKPFFDRKGVFQGFRGSGRDVTAEEIARQALIAANHELKEAYRQKSEALASLQDANAMLETRAIEMARVQAEIRHSALHDDLTGLPNRRYLEGRITELSAECRDRRQWVAVLHLDLDRFKQINDTAGHATGDALLKHVALRLSEDVCAGSFVARIGGDEFVILCTGDGPITQLNTLSQQIQSALNEPFMYDGNACWSGASIGIAAMRDEATDAETLLVNADIALNRAKSRGRGQCEYFSPQVQAQIIRTQNTANSIRAGITRGEFVPYFQPQIDALTNEIAGFEALVRWQHPTDGLLPPDEFLRIAEDLDVLAALDGIVLQAACHQYHDWAEAGVNVPKIAVNVSARRLAEPGLIDGLRGLNMPPGSISFELLESAFLDEVDNQIAWNIDTLREMGIEIELDDFGSGHASIVSLIRLAPDSIKIDRELVSNIAFDPVRRALVKSIIEIGKSLDVRIIAEGVETEAQASILGMLGCDVLQGYLFAKPMAADDVGRFVRDWNANLERKAV
ncbi:MAG: EAL domain-containing protein [Pseudomonadota bacterium]